MLKQKQFYLWVVIPWLIVMSAHVFGLVFDLYYVTNWYDIPMHIAGGAWAALLFLYVFGVYFNDLPAEWWKVLLFTLGAVALIGVMWEFYEYLYDVLVASRRVFFENQIRGLFDTLKDLFNDLLGGAMVSIGYVIFTSRSKRSKRAESRG